MLDRGWAYLEKYPTELTAPGTVGWAVAGIGLAAYKYTRRFGRGDTALPGVTQWALARALHDAQDASSLGRESNYSLGLGLVFLTEVAPYDHMAEIDVYWDVLQRHQKQNGSWGYHGQS